MSDRRKRILNRTEYQVDQLLAEYASETGYRVNLKMRFRDAFDIDDLKLSYGDRNFLWTSHLDFVAIDMITQLPVLAIEYDGPMHSNNDQARRDLIKDRLCRENGLQLLRLDSSFARKEGRWVVLKYILWAHERGKAFYKAQENGHVPRDEPFYHGCIVEKSEGGSGWEFAGLDMSAVRYLRTFRKSYQAAWQKQWWRGDEREVEASDVLSLPNDLYLTSRCKIRNFAIAGISALDISQELSTAELGLLARKFANGEAVANGKRDASRILNEMTAWHISSTWGNSH